MALILDLVKNDISLNNVLNWLDHATIHEDFKELLMKNDITNINRYSFPFLLVTFIREQSSRILKLHNIGPHEANISASPKREILLPTVNNLSLSSPSPTFKNSGNSQETRRIRKVTPQRLDLSSDSAFPSLQQSTQIKEVPKKRRINPTQLQESPVSVRVPLQFGSCSKPSPPTIGNAFNQAKEQVCHKNLDQERALLKERKQQLTIPTIPDTLTTSVPKSWSCIEPDIALVTQQAELDRLSALLSFCLSHNLISSLYNEIQFLIQLLVIRVSPARLKQTQIGSSLLGSVHNCVYLSAKTLETVESVWDHLDPSVLHQLIDNPRLAIFSSKWINQKLVQLVSSSTEDRIPLQRTIANVAFQSDTDNRFNFASDSSFQVFRKQRDQFCEVWQIWKVNSSVPSWNMNLALQKMIQSLVDLRRDSVNYAHLARLFRSQLLNVAQLVKPIHTEEEADGPLSQLQSSDPDKLRRLKERLINPPESRQARYVGGENDIKIAFVGDQEFFRDFILLAASPAFNEHLKNSLVAGIEDLSRSEECDSRAQFAETVIALQVMAKFLAFLNFYPYTSADHLPEHIFHHLSRLRSSQREPIDLQSHMAEAFQKGRLVLVVPWIVTYITLADPVSLCLPGFHPLLCHLVFTYRKAELAPANSFFVRILLSWLFDQPNFPRSLLAKTDDELLVELHQYSLADDQLPQLDQSQLVDSSLIHQCCPFLWSWKHLLTEFASSDAKSSGEKTAASRKITPVSAEESTPSPVKTSAVKSLQQSLEENFFHNQPSSVKRTVEFVAERLASNIVRDIRHQIIPRLALSAQADLRSWTKVDDPPRLETVCRKLCVDVRNEAVSSAASAVASLDATLAALLPNDLLPPVRKVCVVIASKLTHGKVLDWINLHVTMVLFKNDLEVECAKLEKMPRRIPLPSSTPLAATNAKLPVVHDATTQAPSSLIGQLKTMIRQVIHDVAKVTAQDVATLLSHTEGTLQRRVDVTPGVSKCLQQLTFEFLFILCVFQPESVGSDAIVAWVDFWCRTYSANETVSPETEEPPPGALISSSLWQVLTPKQLLLLAQSTSPRDSWNHVTTLLLQLLKSGLVRYKDVQEQAVAVVRQEWPQELLGRFATCVRDIVDWHRSQMKKENVSDKADGENANNDDALLSWLSWFCSQDDL